jgi:DNA (cytosine-5)-methyltransferase 1
MIHLDPAQFAEVAGISPGNLNVMICCAPCTGLSRAKPTNHSFDSPKNNLVARSGDFVAALRPELIFMENARELALGNFKHHHSAFCQRLAELGYQVRSNVHLFSRFGLPQIRERSLVIASRIGPVYTLDDLWAGWRVNPDAVTVRSALHRLARWREQHPSDPQGEVFPGMGPIVLKRLKATPVDGGGWVDVARSSRKRHLLTANCRRRWEAGDLGSHPDVYGRMWWDKPAPTIKRECAHVGNGRYAHPTEDRLLSVREMATLQGFPFDYQFPARAMSNRYRHIGDAVPPILSYQMSALAVWMKTGIRPTPDQWVLPHSSLEVGDIISVH